MENHTEAVAEQLSDWFRSILHFTGESLFGIVPEGPHRDAVVLDVLKRNARILSEAELDNKGELYSPPVSSWPPHAASWGPPWARGIGERPWTMWFTCNIG